MRTILAGLLLCTAFAVGDAHAQLKEEPTRRGYRARQGADRCRRLRKLPHRRSRKTIRRGKADRHAVRRHLLAQSDAGPRYRPRRVERRRVLSRAAVRRGARRLALLSGLPLPEFHETDPPGHSRHPGLSGDADAGPKCAPRARAALAAELSRRDARLELAVLQAGHSHARPAKERGMESRPLSGRGRQPLRRLPYAEEHVRRRQTRPGLRRQPRAGHVRAAARRCPAQRPEILERGRHRRVSAERP